MNPNTYERIPLHLRIQAGYRMAHRLEHAERVTDIATDLNISRSHLYVLEEKYAEDPTMVDRPRDGRPPKVDDHLARRVIREMTTDPSLTSTTIARLVNEEMEEEKQISSDTVQRIAHEAGYFSYKPVYKPPLDDDRKADRLQFARLHQDRTMHFWRSTIFMDETFIRLHPKDTRKRIWRHQGEQMEEENVIPLFRHGGGGVLFWGCVSWMGPGPLIPIFDTLTGNDYAQILLDNIPQVKALLNLQSAKIIEDGPRVHTTQRVLEAKQELHLTDLDLPGYSPDLNIIENLWSLLKTRIADRAPQSLDEITNIAVEEWANITVEEIRAYFYSIPNRLAEVVRARGGYTRY